MQLGEKLRAPPNQLRLLVINAYRLDVLYEKDVWARLPAEELALYFHPRDFTSPEQAAFFFASFIKSKLGGSEVAFLVDDRGRILYRYWGSDVHEEQSLFAFY